MISWNYFHSGDGVKAVVEEAQDKEVTKTDTEENSNVSHSDTDTAPAANPTSNDTDQTSSTGNDNEVVDSSDPDNSAQTDKVSVLYHKWHVILDIVCRLVRLLLIRRMWLQWLLPILIRWLLVVIFFLLTAIISVGDIRS